MGRTRTVTNFRSLFRNGQSITSGNPLRLGFKPTDDALMPATGINRPILSFIVNPGRGGGRFRVNVLNGDRLINIVPSTQINDGVMRTFNEIIPGDIFRGQAGNQNIAFEHQGGTIQIRDVIIWYNRKIKVQSNRFSCRQVLGNLSPSSFVLCGPGVSGFEGQGYTEGMVSPTGEAVPFRLSRLNVTCPSFRSGSTQDNPRWVISGKRGDNLASRIAIIY